jgi:hypothetical protein
MYFTSDALGIKGHEKLVVPVTDSNADVIFYCSSDSLFDVLHDTHLSIGHKQAHSFNMSLVLFIAVSYFN